MPSEEQVTSKTNKISCPPFRCNNFRTCKILAEHYDFGPNPCPDTERYLEASYVCVQNQQMKTNGEHLWKKNPFHPNVGFRTHYYWSAFLSFWARLCLEALYCFSLYYLHSCTFITRFSGLNDIGKFSYPLGFRAAQKNFQLENFYTSGKVWWQRGKRPLLIWFVELQASNNHDFEEKLFSLLLFSKVGHLFLAFNFFHLFTVVCSTYVHCLQPPKPSLFARLIQFSYKKKPAYLKAKRKSCREFYWFT